MDTEGGVFTAGETHGRALRPANRLIAHSQEQGWRSLYAAVLEEAPLSTKEAAVGHPSLIYHIARPTRVTRCIDGLRREHALIGPRRICLTPGRSAAQWRHSGRPQILQLYLRSGIYENAVREMYGRDLERAEIVPRFAIVDPLLEQLAVATINALQDGSTEDGLYVDSLTQMIAVHLARHYARGAGSERTPVPATAAEHRKLGRLLDFIEAHVADDLSLDAMAAEIGVGPLYLSRVFKNAVGQSPHQYVLRRRVERAKALLRDTDMPIVEVAMSSGFCSQSHLSNWFRRIVGASPAAYRRQV